MPLAEYIATRFGGNNTRFAEHMGVPRQKVNDWLTAGWLVVGNQLCSPRREIPDVRDDR